MSRGIIILILIFLIDLYAYQAFRSAWSGKSEQFQRIAFFIYWGLTLLSLGCVVTANISDWKLWPHQWRIFLFSVVFILTASKLFIIPFLLIDDLQRFFRWVGSLIADPKTKPVFTYEGRGITRAKFLSVIGLIIAAIPFASLLYGMIRGPYAFNVRNLTLNVPRLPGNFNGMKILQISDLHIGSWKSEEPLKRAVKLIMEQKPDLILFTGDLVNDMASEVNGYEEILSQIKAPLGVYSVLGNHDYGDYVNWESTKDKIENLERLKQIQKDLGWKLLINEHDKIIINGEELAILGVENWSSRRGFHQYGDITKAYNGLYENDFKILMTHDPTHFSAVISKEFTDIDITFSGHTHGFQYGVDIPGFKWSPVQYVYDHWMGLYKVVL
jgi:predicted MPP superfamily phosphohydrolase